VVDRTEEGGIGGRGGWLGGVGGGDREAGGMSEGKQTERGRWGVVTDGV